MAKQLNEGDEVRLILSPETTGTIVAVDQDLNVRHPDDTVETLKEGVLFQPTGTEDKHLFHPSCFEPIN